MGFPEFFAIPRYFIRLRSRLLRCSGFEERVGQEIPSHGFGDLYERAVQTEAAGNPTEMNEGVEKTFAVARESKITHTVSVETIEYRRMKKWRGAAWKQEFARSARCGDAALEP
jgi:hypothetical protein